MRLSRWALLALLILVVPTFASGMAWADPDRSEGKGGRSVQGQRQGPAETGQAQEEDAEAHEGDTDEEETSEDGATRSGPGRSSPRWSARRGATEASRPSRPSRRSEAEGADQEAHPGEQAEGVEVSFSASPASIAVGDTSTLTVAVSNPTDQAVAGAEVLVELPPHLEVVSSDPPASGDATSLRIRLGGLAPGADVTATLVVRGIGPSLDEDPVRFAVVVDDRTFHHELFVAVAGDPAGGLTLTQNAPLLVQVGRSASFSVTVSNSSDAPLEDVVVATEIAPEIDVVGVAPVDAADAVLLGASPGREAIAWTFDSLEPGEEVALTWTGRAVVPGDLEAANVVTASLQGRPETTSQQNTYLGYVRGVRTHNPGGAEPVVRKQVVTKLVPVGTEVAGSVGGGILPVTGWSPLWLVSAASVSIALGALILWASRRPGSRRLPVAVAVLLLLTATACVSDDAPSEPDARAPATASPGAGEGGTPAEEEEQEDEVLGVRIDRPAREGRAQEEEQEDAIPITQAEPVAEPAVEVVYQQVSEVVTVVVPPHELPVETLASRAGDNDLSFSWTPETDDLQAASSRRLSSDAREELLVGLSVSGRALLATVSVANLADDRRLQVDGRLALELAAADGRTSSLLSEPIHVVLEPGARTSVDLAFSLPTGSYTAKGAFFAD